MWHDIMRLLRLLRKVIKREDYQNQKKVSHMSQSHLLKAYLPGYVLFAFKTNSSHQWCAHCANITKSFLGLTKYSLLSLDITENS